MSQLMTRKQWVEAQAQRQEVTKLRSHDEWTALIATEKAERKISKSVNRTIASLSIMDKLRQLREQSAAESLSMLIITPLNGKKQTVIVLEDDYQAQLPKIEAYFEAILEANAEAREIKMGSLYPTCKWRLDLYVSGKELNLANLNFSTLSVQSLPFLGRTLAMANKLGQLVAPVTFTDVEVLKFAPEEVAKIAESVTA